MYGFVRCFLSRAPENPTVSGSGLKLHRDGGHGLKSQMTGWWNPGSNYGPLGTRRVTYPLLKD